MRRRLKNVVKVYRRRFARAVRPTVERWAAVEPTVARRPAPTPGPPPATGPAAGADPVAPEPALPTDTSPIHDPALQELEDVFDTFDEMPASYMHALHETKRRMTMVRRLGVRHPWWTLNGKYAAYRYVAAHGMSHPEVYGRFSSITEVDPDALGGRFLIKPEGGSTNRGIYGLDHQRDRTYIDRITGKKVEWDAVVDEYTALVADGKVTGNLIVEELLRKPGGDGAIPDDFKVYCFYDRASLVMQRDLAESANRSKWRFKFWSRDWVDLGAIKYADRVDPDLDAPVHGAALIEEAERLGALLRLPFVRLDFYDTDRGVVFGEVTLNPGPPEIFGPEFDEYLGRQREYAAARLLAEDVGAGHWDHLLPPDA